MAHRYLIGANQTLGRDPLTTKLRACLPSQPCRFHVVVPATPPRDQLTWTEGEAQEIASRRLEGALGWFRARGVEATGEVGDASPLAAVGDVLARERFDEVIVSTLPPGVSRWLKMDLPQRVARTFGVPVTTAVAPEPVPSAA